jgi:hypothetical protein
MTPGPEDEVSQAEKRRVTLQDAELRRGSTYHQHGLAQADEIHQGRFAATTGGAPRVIASTPNVGGQYSQLPESSPWSGAQPEPGLEPPTGYCIDEMPGFGPSAVPVCVEATGPVSDPAPSADRVADALRPAAGPFSQKDQENG